MNPHLTMAAASVNSAESASASTASPKERRPPRHHQRLAHSRTRTQGRRPKVHYRRDTSAPGPRSRPVCGMIVTSPGRDNGLTLEMETASTRSASGGMNSFARHRTFALRSRLCSAEELASSVRTGADTAAHRSISGRRKRLSEPVDWPGWSRAARSEKEHGGTGRIRRATRPSSAAAPKLPHEGSVFKAGGPERQRRHDSVVPSLGYVGGALAGGERESLAGIPSLLGRVRSRLEVTKGREAQRTPRRGRDWTRWPRTSSSDRTPVSSARGGKGGRGGDDGWSPDQTSDLQTPCSRRFARARGPVRGARDRRNSGPAILRELELGGTCSTIVGAKIVRSGS